MTDQLRDMVRGVIDGNRYMTVGTVESDGMPRLSPVYFTHDRYQMFYWVSSPTARHSQNVLRQPKIAVVVFDSSLAPSGTEAVYLSATAQQVPDDELATECEVAFRGVGGGARAFGPGELSGAAALRLYRARATSYAVHIRGSHPTFGTGIDIRMPVDMTS
jgi:pyridoxamine 5'-phosphate oxidase-like protein